MKTDMTIAGLLMHDNKVLLIHHKKLKMWLPLGGHIEKDETPDDAVIREFKEELNIEVEILNKNELPLSGNIVRQLAVPFYINVHKVGDHDHCCFFYLCKPKNLKKIKINKSELVDYKWFSIKDIEDKSVPDDVKNIVKKAFEMFSKLK